LLCVCEGLKNKPAFSDPTIILVESVCFLKNILALYNKKISMVGDTNCTIYYSRPVILAYYNKRVIQDSGKEGQGGGATTTTTHLGRKVCPRRRDGLIYMQEEIFSSA